MSKWKLVPVEPTPLQLRDLDQVLDWDPSADARQVYADMLDNAPPPPRCVDIAALKDAMDRLDRRLGDWDYMSSPDVGPDVQLVLDSAKAYCELMEVSQ